MLLCEKFQYLFEKETHEPQNFRKPIFFQVTVLIIHHLNHEVKLFVNSVAAELYSRT